METRAITVETNKESFTAACADAPAGFGTARPVTRERLQALVADLEQQLVTVEACDTEAPPTILEGFMAGEWIEMKQRLDEATDRLEWAPDPEAKELLPTQRPRVRAAG